MERTHGGDWAAYEREYGEPPLDFSANVSPLGVPNGVRAAIAAAAERADRYPDPACAALRSAIASREGVRPEQILCGNGASELIYRAIYAAKPRRALVTAPTFGEYEAALEAADCEIVRYPLDRGFHLDGEVLKRIDNNIDIVILCQPNNPSGVTIEPELLRAAAARCRAAGSRLILDECFVELLDVPERCAATAVLNGEGRSAGGVLEAWPGILILRAFTKLYGLAGVRLGYALCGDGAFLDAMRRSGPPWPVSALAQAAGLAALREKSYVNAVRMLVREERTWLYRQFCAIGLSPVQGEANFLLFHCPTPLDEPLRERGILIRRCADFAGLDGDWYRAAVRTRAENERLVAALRVILGEAT